MSEIDTQVLSTHKFRHTRKKHPGLGLRDATMPDSDRPLRKLPNVPMGENANVSLLLALCPNRDYKGCFSQALSRRYPSVDLNGPMRGEDFSLDAAAHALRKLPKCAVFDHRTSTSERTVALPADIDGPGESFTSSALRGTTSTRLVAPLADNDLLRTRLREASAGALTRLPRGTLRCGSSSRSLDYGLLILLGLPTTALSPGSGRRDAARTSWMAHAAYGRSVAACFLLSAHGPRDETAALITEQGAYADLLLLDVPETRALITAKTAYSNFTRLGRGMPTFKQYAFFQHAARMLPHVPYVGKIDDDTAPNLTLLVALGAQLRCKEHLFIGAINWAGVVPQARNTGVRNDRCGFGWGAGAALANYGATFGKPCSSFPCPSYFPPCDKLGAVPPFPYGTGAGYVFGAATLRWVATDAAVINWVRQAAGPTRDAIQWQKFEDTSTGYWLSYAPFTVLYVNVGRWVHDFVCHKNGAHKAEGGGLYRPPCNLTLFVHNLKHGGFHYASHAMSQGATLYDHEQCTSDGGTRIRRRGRLSSHNEGVFKSRGGLGRKRPRLED